MKYTALSFILSIALLFTACANASQTGQTAQAQSGPNVSEEAPEQDKTSQITWSIMPQHTTVMRDGSEAVYLYLNVKSSRNETDKRRVPLNISLVLDRSGSMNGDKILYAKKAAHFVIDQLEKGDILSIVNYDNVIEITSPQGFVSNKEALKAKVDKLTERGGTNLTGGMLEGYSQVKSMKREGYVNRVLLLTDGLANEGITDPLKMKKLAADKYALEGIALSTFGLGAGYNEELLTALAESGGANYYFIGEADRISEIFNRELQGLLSVLGQNSVVSLNLPEGTTCEKVFGYPFEQSNGKVLIRLSDIYANDEKGIVIKLKTKTLTNDFQIDAELKYTETVNFNIVKETKKLILPLSENRVAWAKGKNTEVEAKVVYFEANDEFENVMTDVDNGDFATAKGKAEQTLTKLRTQQAYAPSEKLKKQEDEISQYVKDLASVQAMPATEKSLYQKGNKSRNYEDRKMKR